MSWTKRIKNPSKILKVGDTIEAVIADVNAETRRLSLSLRATEPNPWEHLAEKFRIGDRITGTVRNLTDFGAFVEIEEGIDGLVHVSDMSWGRRVKHPSEVLKKGDQVQAILTAIDVENRRISLSIKEFRPNEWEQFAAAHQPGDVLDGIVAKVADFGVFVRLPEGLEGLMHVSETDLSRGEKPVGAFQGRATPCASASSGSSRWSSGSDSLPAASPRRYPRRPNSPWEERPADRTLPVRTRPWSPEERTGESRPALSGRGENRWRSR